MNYARLITGSRSFMDHFNKREYLRYCQKHQQDCATLYAEILNEDTDQRALAQSILADLQRDWENHSWLKRKTMLETDMMFCVAFFLPCLASQNNEVLTSFAKEFAAIWNGSGIKRSKINVTTIDHMQSGFSRNLFGFGIKSKKKS